MSLGEPDTAEVLPALQSINRIVKPFRDGLQGEDPLGKNWSLSLWMREDHGIARKDLPLILRVQREMATDIEERSRIRFRDNRLTVREARWVAPIHTVLTAHEQPSEDDWEKTHSLRNQLARGLGWYRRLFIPLVKSYALRERAVELMDNPVDSYDLDMDLDMDTLSRGPRQLHLLYKEMGLLPVSTTMPGGQEMLDIEYRIVDLSGGITNVPGLGKLGLARWGSIVRQVISAMSGTNNPVRVRFGTGDWNKHAQFGIVAPEDKIPTYMSEMTYDIDLTLLDSIWPLVKDDRKIVERDHQPVKVATAFWQKIQEKVSEMLDDPKTFEEINNSLRDQGHNRQHRYGQEKHVESY